MKERARLASLMTRPEFPRSSKYDPEWVIEHRMGLNALWPTEWLCEKMNLQPGMRVLDLGCGKALSSIFLAREFDLQVWATDLWIGATENFSQVAQFNLRDSVFPIHADARQLPFADEFFDAIVCIDSYIYFGTDDLYLDYIRLFLKPAGELGVVLNCFTQQLWDRSPTTWCRSGRRSAGHGTRSIGGNSTGEELALSTSTRQTLFRTDATSGCISTERDRLRAMAAPR